MPVITADLAKCEGYGNCVIAAPDLMDIDDDGVVVLLRAEIPAGERGRAENAARSCPVAALSVTDQ